MIFDVKEFLKLITGYNSDLNEKCMDNNLYNMYAMSCESDLSDANIIRIRNLEALLLRAEVFDAVLVGEAPGHLGARFTGLPFTDEYRLPIAQQVWKTGHLRESSYYDIQPVKENSAKFVWDVMPLLVNPPMMWNIIPFHPFQDKLNHHSNRTPNSVDYELTRHITHYFFDKLDFDRIFAIGRVAEKYLNKHLGYDAVYIRHPSHGGSKKFHEGMMENFEVR